MPADLLLTGLRLVHTGVFAVECVAIAYMIWRGVRGGCDRWAVAAVILTAGTGLGLLLNDGECIFQTWAEQISGEEVVSDIYLPVTVARLIVPVSLPFVALGYGLLAWRCWQLHRSG